MRPHWLHRLSLHELRQLLLQLPDSTCASILHRSGRTLSEFRYTQRLLGETGCELQNVPDSRPELLTMDDAEVEAGKKELNLCRRYRSGDRLDRRH